MAGFIVQTLNDIFRELRMPRVREQLEDGPLFQVCVPEAFVEKTATALARTGKVVDFQHFSGEACFNVCCSKSWTAKTVQAYVQTLTLTALDTIKVRPLAMPHVLARIKESLADLSAEERVTVFNGLGLWCPHCGRDTLPCDCLRTD